MLWSLCLVIICLLFKANYFFQIHHMILIIQNSQCICFNALRLTRWSYDINCVTEKKKDQISQRQILVMQVHNHHPYIYHKKEEEKKLNLEFNISLIFIPLYQGIIRKKLWIVGMDFQFWAKKPINPFKFTALLSIK